MKNAAHATMRPVFTTPCRDAGMIEADHGRFGRAARLALQQEHA
jgi:hypothetical protein